MAGYHAPSSSTFESFRIPSGGFQGATILRVGSLPYPASLSGAALLLRASDLGANNTSAVGWVNQVNGQAAQVRALGYTSGPLVKTGATPGGAKAVEWPSSVGMSGPADTQGTSLDFGPIMFTGTDVAAIYASSMYDENAYSVSRVPKTLTFEGSADGSSWTTLDTQTTQTFSGSTPRLFSFSNTTAYLYYRL